MKKKTTIYTSCAYLNLRHGVFSKSMLVLIGFWLNCGPTEACLAPDRGGHALQGTSAGPAKDDALAERAQRGAGVWEFVSDLGEHLQVKNHGNMSENHGSHHHFPDSHEMTMSMGLYPIFRHRNLVFPETSGDLMIQLKFPTGGFWEPRPYF